MRLMLITAVFLIIFTGCGTDNLENGSQNQVDSSVFPVTIQVINKQKGGNDQFKLYILSDGKETKDYAVFPVSMHTTTVEKGKVIINLHSGVKYQFSVYAINEKSIRHKKTDVSGKVQPQLPLIKKTIIGPKHPTTIELVVTSEK